MRLHRYSIRWKLVFALVAMSAISVILCLAGVAVYEISTSSTRAKGMVQTVGETLVIGIGSAVEFQDTERIKSLLGGLQSLKWIESAWILDRWGKPIAAYPDGKRFMVAPAAPDDEPVWREGRLIFRKPVANPLDPMQNYRIVLVTSKQFSEQIRSYLTTLILVFSVLGALGVVFAFFLQRSVMDPLAELARVATAVTEQSDYSRRVAVRGRDEISSLTVSFNRMLDAVEQNRSALALNEERLRLALESSRLAAWGWDLSTDRMVWSDGFFAILGIRSTEIAGGLDGYLAWVHPDDRSLFRSQLRALVDGTGQVFRSEHRIRPGVDRKVTWVEFRGSLTRDSFGRGVQMSGTVADISDRKLAEERLQACITNTPNVAVQWFDEDGKVIFWNRASEILYGWTEREVMGRPVEETTHVGEAAAEFRRQMQHVRSTREAVGPVELKLRRKSGSECICLATLFSLPAQEGRECFVCMQVDITRRQRAEEGKVTLEKQLRQSQKLEALGTMAGGIAHDFNNILCAILGFTNLAKLELPEGHPALPSLAEILRSGLRARDLVQRILLFSRQDDLPRHRLELPPVVQEAIALLRSAIPASIDLVTEVEPGVPMVLSDPLQIQQIILNMGTNSYHAMQDRTGRIVIRVAGCRLDEVFCQAHPGLAPGRYAMLEIGDNGAGMSPEVMSRIFDPFFTTKEPGQGTGLGLSQVHGIVQAHGGVVTVDSVAGVGTTFRIYLPDVDAGVRVDAVPKPRNAAAVDGGGKHILYVDDEETLVHLAKRYLERAGYRVTACQHPQEAMALFLANPDSFDLVVTDQSMPGMTGMELAREILARRPEAPVVLASGYLRPGELESARALGVMDVFQKPFTMEDYCEAIGRLIANRREGRADR